jgi:hypothetical protein
MVCTLSKGYDHLFNYWVDQIELISEEFNLGIIFRLDLFL